MVVIQVAHYSRWSTTTGSCNDLFMLSLLCFCVCRCLSNCAFIGCPAYICHNKRKALSHQLLDTFNTNTVVPYLARNIGVWKTRSNTLSILDVTLLTPLYGERLKAKLYDAFSKQIKDLGFGREVGVYSLICSSMVHALHFQFAGFMCFLLASFMT